MDRKELVERLSPIPVDYLNNNEEYEKNTELIIKAWNMFFDIIEFAKKHIYTIDITFAMIQKIMTIAFNKYCLNQYTSFAINYMARWATVFYPLSDEEYIHCKGLILDNLEPIFTQPILV